MLYESTKAEFTLEWGLSSGEMYVGEQSITPGKERKVETGAEKSAEHEGSLKSEPRAGKRGSP